MHNTGLDLSTIDSWLAKIAPLRVGIIGDIALDVYWDADMTKSRLARENPHYFLPVMQERLSPGGAGTTACCAAALGVADVCVLGVIGDDWRGRELARILPEAGVNTADLLVTTERTTLTYVKPRRSGLSDLVYEDPHLYFENQAPPSAALTALVLERLERLLTRVDVLIVADYQQNGLLSPLLRDRISDAARDGMCVLVDSRDHLLDYRHVVVKPNEVELAVATAILGQAATDAPVTVAKALARYTQAPVCVTLGAAGSLWVEEEIVIPVPAISVAGPIDTVGAGDCFAATLASALAVGSSGPQAAQLATLAANVVIRKIGTTGTATPAEIRRLAQENLA